MPLEIRKSKLDFKFPGNLKTLLGTTLVQISDHLDNLKTKPSGDPSLAWFPDPGFLGDASLAPLRPLGTLGSPGYLSLGFLGDSSFAPLGPLGALGFPGSLTLGFLGDLRLHRLADANIAHSPSL